MEMITYYYTLELFLNIQDGGLEPEADNVISV